MKKRIMEFRKGGLILIFLLANNAHLLAQGNQGILAATEEVAGFFNSGVQLMYAIGAIVGLVGAVKVFNKWNSGDPDTGKVAAAWFGSCVFLVVVAIVLQSFFGGNVGP